jgi:hypothetical protein
MGRIIKLSKIEFLLENPENVKPVIFDEIEEIIDGYRGDGWRLPTIEELLYIRSLLIDLDLIKELISVDDYWSSTEGTVTDYNPPDPRWFYQLRFQKNPSPKFLSHVGYTGNVLPVRDI